MGKTDRSGWKHGCTERINMLRDAYFANEPEIDIERAVSYTKTYKETEGEHISIRRAKALYNYFAEKTINIQTGQLLAGTYGKKPRAAVVNPDVSWSWLDAELDTISTRNQDPYFITEEDKRILREQVFPYWEGKSAQDCFYANIDEIDKKLVTETSIISAVHSETGVGEMVPDYGNHLFVKGFKGIQEDAEAQLASMDRYDGERYDKQKFYEAVIITCKAAKLQSDRYAKEAKALADVETDIKRRKELEEIAEMCSRVPYEPPRTFVEAVQFVWLSMVLLWTEENGTAICIDRPDQYLYKFYKADREAGILDDVKAQEIIECLWLHMAEIIYFISDDSSKYYAGYQTFHGLTLSGCDIEGKDVTNELSYMMIQATMDLRMHSPTTNVRLTPDTPQEFKDKILDLVKLGTGQPAIYFDSTAFGIMEKKGCSETDAKRWCVGGCVEPHIPGKTHRWNEGGRYSYANAVEWVLFDGYSKAHGEYFGLRTGNPCNIKSFAEFKDKVKEQLAYLIEKTTSLILVTEKIHMDRLPKLVQSCMTIGCIESGKDSMHGGAIYNFGPGMETTGIADLADSMAAVKKFVFDEKRMTMKEMVEILDSDFEGNEDVRQMLLNEGPKYGNDDDFVDDILTEFVEFAVSETKKHKNNLGVSFCTGAVPVTANVPHGKSTWALPSGRKALDALADGASPANGCDVKGPTAVIKSVCKPDHTLSSCGTLLNVKFAPELLKSEAGKANFNSLLGAERDLGGYHVQFNVVNNDTLKEAQKNPKKYTNLLVRVAGYSAFFVDLHKDTQDAIIGRTENTHW
ncbi:MAG: formate C-acetyltransferase/glycerol dehydratase family glycyl radical enzyme [Lachnospiraceae bacterium]|nr:formate C-acetyltransferase/glycerol dehydratase family glycyl radical enzyme [Lachnospiraceae bacterium]